MSKIKWFEYVKVVPHRYNAYTLRVMAEMDALDRAKVIEKGTWDGDLNECLTDEWECIRLAAKARLEVLNKRKPV